jgi:putative drug/metabolite transporter DUF486
MRRDRARRRDGDQQGEQSGKAGYHRQPNRCGSVAPEPPVCISRSPTCVFPKASVDLKKRLLMPALFSWPYMLPILMLIGSNVFMTFAWYWHLRHKEVPLFGVILASWALAFIEYCLAVPANRWGDEVY